MTVPRSVRWRVGLVVLGIALGSAISGCGTGRPAGDDDVAADGQLRLSELQGCLEAAGSSSMYATENVFSGEVVGLFYDLGAGVILTLGSMTLLHPVWLVASPTGGDVPPAQRALVRRCTKTEALRGTVLRDV